MDIRIGVTQSPREITLEVEDDAAARKKLKPQLMLQFQEQQMFCG